MTTELYHHGVKGQSWGKKNGPPYPLYRKSAYYKKNGKRPPGYTGDKKGKSDDGGPNKSGKIGGIDIDLKNKRIKIGDTNKLTKKEREEKKEKIKKVAKVAAIGAGVAAGYLAYKNKGKIQNSFETKTKLGRILKGRRNSEALAKHFKNVSKANISEANTIDALRKKGMSSEEISKKFGALRGDEDFSKMARSAASKASAAASIKAKQSARYNELLKKYVKGASIKAGIGAAGVGVAAAVRNKLKNRNANGKIGGYDDYESESEKKAKLKKRILIGAGIAAGVAGGALLGRKLYRAKAAQGAAGVESAASNLRSAFKRNKAAQSEAKKIAADLTNQRNKLTIDRFNAQTARNEAAAKKGLSGFLKRRKIKKNIANLDSKLAENAAAKSRNAFTAGETEMKYKYAQRALKDSLASNESLKKLGKRQAIASTLGLGAAGGATGYGISKIANRRNQKARIQNRRKKRR